MKQISAIIKKKKKGEVPMESTMMEGLPQMHSKQEEQEPKEEYEVSEQKEQYEMPSAKQGKVGPVPHAKLELELMLSSAKKKDSMEAPESTKMQQEVDKFDARKKYIEKLKKAK